MNWLITHETDDYVLAINLHSRTMLIEAHFNGGLIEILYDQFRSFSYMSECLRDYSHCQFAVEALEANAVPHDHPLWTLGFKGGDTYWKQF